MERVEFSYIFTVNGIERRIFFTDGADADGLNSRDVCEMFLDFMQAAGFTKENILDYFKE